MIPKVIHYCWFGRKELTPLAKKCLRSWSKFLPDYEIRRWDETNFDVHMVPYTSEAYRQRKYAFVSDYARFWILYNYGGLYFDTDVEIIRPMGHIVSAGPFMGREDSGCHPAGKCPGLAVAPGLGIGAGPRHPVYKELIEYYKTLYFGSASRQKLPTVVDHVTGYFERRGLLADDRIRTIEGITVYPKEYFCPMDPVTGKCEVTSNSVSIHHYAASWQPLRLRLKKRLKNLLGPAFTSRYICFKRFLRESCSKGN